MAVVSKTELIKLQKSLRTDLAIARKFKVTRQAIQQLRNKYDIVSNWDKKPERDKRIIAMYKSGKTAEKIALNVRLSVAQIYRVTSGQRSKKK
jgi:DNA invertase Pin-like site-specific DNA recombinase